MSPLEQVLAAAKKLYDDGKEPSLALIKTKLGNSIPMRVLIQGLQQFKSLSEQDKQAISSTISSPATLSQANSTSTAHADKLVQLENELSELKAELSTLKQQFDQFKQTHIISERSEK